MSRPTVPGCGGANPVAAWQRALLRRFAGVRATCKGSRYAAWKTSRDDSGASLVEMALVSAVLFAIVFAIIEFAIVLYSYHFVSEAAREATRYAAVRGSNSCNSSSNLLTDCNLGPTTSGDPLLKYIQSLGYPGLDASQFQDYPTWWIAADPPVNGYVKWSLQCLTLLDSLSVPCNVAGNEVRVKVVYAMPLNIPFWGNTTINLTSTSSMVITN